MLKKRKIEETFDKEGRRVLRLTDGKLEADIALDLGIRILRFGFSDENELYLNDKDFENTRLDEHKMYGGHRLWHTPEDRERTYLPDNKPVKYSISDGMAEIEQADDGSGIIKRMTVALKGGKFTIRHEIENAGYWEIETSLWAITQLKSGGVAAAVMNREDTGLLPSRKLIVWPYTDMSSGAVTFGKDTLRVTSILALRPLKIGLDAEGFLSYFNGGHMFVKKFIPTSEEYPDFGCNAEIYACKDFLEAETLSPVYLLGRGEREEHYEEWSLYEESLPKSEEQFMKTFEKYGLIDKQK